MAQNNVTIGGQVTVVNSGLKSIINLSDSFTTTGSNSITNNANVSTSSWVVIDQGSNTNYRYGFYSNLSATSSIKLSLNVTTSYSAYLEPGDVAIIPNSGSAVIYATATSGDLNPPPILQYVIVEN
jgi:hypothetical protein